MQALLWGVAPDGDPWTPPDPDNPLLRGLAQVPMRLVEQERPRPEREGWVVARTRMAGICGSEAKQVFGEFSDTYPDSPLATFFTGTAVLGHEVVADVANSARAPRASRWVSGWCSTRGCPAGRGASIRRASSCLAGDY